MIAFLRTNAVLLTLAGCAGGIALIATEPWPLRAVGVALVAAGLMVPFLRLGVRSTKTQRGFIPASTFEIPLEDIGVDEQTREILARRKITNVGTLLICDPDEVLNLPGMDPARLLGIRENMMQHGILPAAEEVDAAHDEDSTTVEQVSKWLRQQPAATA